MVYMAVGQPWFLLIYLNHQIFKPKNTPPKKHNNNRHGNYHHKKDYIDDDTTPCAR